MKEVGQVDTIRPALSTAFGPGDMTFLQFPEAQTCADFDEDLAEEAAEIMKALGELREGWKILFPSYPQSPPRPSTLTHHDPALSNILALST